MKNSHLWNIWLPKAEVGYCGVENSNVATSYHTQDTKDGVVPWQRIPVSAAGWWDSEKNQAQYKSQEATQVLLNEEFYPEIDG